MVDLGGDTVDESVRQRLDVGMIALYDKKSAQFDHSEIKDGKRREVKYSVPLHGGSSSVSKLGRIRKKTAQSHMNSR